VLLILGAGLLAPLPACGSAATGSTGAPASPSLPAAATLTATPTAAGKAAAGGVSQAEACRRYTQIMSNPSMLDDSSASALADLAGHVSDARLAAAIAKVGQAVADNDPAPRDATVRAACPQG
jgi:hypothetical protein